MPPSLFRKERRSPFLNTGRSFEENVRKNVQENVRYVLFYIEGLPVMRSFSYRLCVMLLVVMRSRC